MKFAVLLALVGLASCSTTLIGGDRARDVTIQYTYLDENGREVKVELEADSLSLGFGDETFRREPTTSSVRLSPVAETRSSLARTRFVQVVPAPEPEPQFVRVIPAPEPEPIRPRFLQVAPIPSRHEVQTRFIQAEDVHTPRQEVRFVQVPVRRADVDDLETRFVQVAAEPSARRPTTQARFIEFDDKMPVMVQPATARRVIVPTTIPIAIPAALSRSSSRSVPRFQPRRHISTSDDSSGEKK